MALAAFTLVVLTKDLPGYAELVINRGAGATRVGWILLFQSLSLMAQMLPFAVLVGGLAGLGRLAENLEVLALSTLGFDPRRLIAPVALVGAAVALLALLMTLVISPMAQRGLNRALLEISNINPVAEIEPGIVQRMGDWKLEAREVSNGGQELGRVLLWMPSVGETIFSESARISATPDSQLQIVLRNGVLMLDTREEPRAMRFDEMRTQMPRDDAKRLPFEDDLAGLSLAALFSLAEDPDSGHQGREAQSEIHRRFVFPVAALLFGVLTLPLALARTKTSRSGGTLIGLGITIAYYGLVQAAEGIAQRAPSWSGLVSWLPNLALLVLAVLLYLRMERPSSKAARSERAGSKTRGATGSPAPPERKLRARRWALSRYVAARFIQIAFLSFGALVIAYLLVDILERLQWFARHAATVDEMARFYSARIPLLVSRVTPMGVLVAMALTVSLLTSTGELLGMRSLGISARKALRPTMLVCLFLTPLSFLLNDQVVPRTNQLADLIKARDIKKEGTQRTAVWGTHENTLYQLASLDANRGAADEIIVYKLVSNGLPESRVDARSALHVGAGQWQLRDATGAQLDAEGQLLSITPPLHVELGEAPSAKRDLMYYSVADLLSVIRDLTTNGEATTRFEVDLHLKLATPLACLLLPALIMLIAISGPPFPRSAPVLIMAGAIAVAYTLLTGVFASLGRSGALPPWAGGWGTSLIVFAALMALALRNHLAQRGS